MHDILLGEGLHISKKLALNMAAQTAVEQLRQNAHLLLCCCNSIFDHVSMLNVITI